MNHELPQGWAECTLGDIIKIQNGYAFPSMEFRGSGVPLIRQGNLAGERVSLEKCVYLDPGWLAMKPDFILRKNDVLIGMSGSVGKLCIYDRDEPALQNQRAGKIVQQSTDFVDWRFVWEYLKTVELQLLEKGKGLGVLNVSATDIESLPFRLAPFNEQRRIVVKLEKLLGKVDACQHRLAKIPRILKRFRQSVLAAACSGRLTADWRDENPHAAVKAAGPPEGAPETPESWRWNRLSEVAHVRGGVTKGRKLAGKRTIVLPYLRVANVQDGYLNLSEIKQIEVLPGDETEYGLESGDVLFTEGGDRDKLGRGAVWHDEIPKCIHQNHIFRARLFTLQVTPEYISLVTKSEFSRHYFFDNASQTVNLASINLTTLSALPMPIPPVEEQNEIVHRLEALFKLADQIEARLTKAKNNVDQLTQSVLAKAFRGELVAQDPNDEPASVLLERIKAERTKGETEGIGGGKKRLNVNRKGKGR
jgi:type I restriction enzyme S subunit